MTNVDNLVEGCYLALTSPKASGQIFILSGMGEVSNEEYFSHLSKMLGRKKAKTLPKKVLYSLAYIAEKMANLFGKKTEFNPNSIAMLSRPSGKYSHAKATELLDYHPRVSLDEGMKRCEQWLRAQNMI